MTQSRCSKGYEPILLKSMRMDPEVYTFGPFVIATETLVLGQHQRDRVASHGSIVPLPSNVVFGSRTGHPPCGCFV